ncbi:MAG: GDSL-type esterase/lipase family protein [Candidatus Omnitrophota bacterium]
MKKIIKQLAKKILLIFLGIIFAGLAIELSLQAFICFSGLANQFDQKTRFNCKKVKILCLGDSFTYGIGAEKGFSYPEQLQVMLNEKQNQQEFEVINCGQPGFNTALIVQRALSRIKDLNPNILIIMTGANDYWNLSGLGKDTGNILLELNSLLYNFRSYRLIQIGMSKLIQKNNVYQTGINQLRHKLKPKEFEQALEFLRFIKYFRHFKLSHNYEQALIALDQALNLRYFDQHVFELLDELFIDWRDFSKAICYYERLNQLNPDDGNVDIRLARMYKAVQDYEKSLTFYKKVHALDPDSAEAAAGIINADNFLKQKISKNFTINPDEHSLVCKNNFNLKDIFSENLELADEDYALLLDMILLVQRPQFIKENKYRKSLEPIYMNKLKLLADLCEQKKLKVLFLSYPNFVRDYAYKGLKNKNTEFIDLRDKFAQIVNPKNRSEYESLDAHCTAKGYRLIADIVSEQIIKDLVK